MYHDNSFPSFFTLNTVFERSGEIRSELTRARVELVNKINDSRSHETRSSKTTRPDGTETSSQTTATYGCITCISTHRRNFGESFGGAKILF